MLSFVFVRVFGDEIKSLLSRFLSHFCSYQFAMLLVQLFLYMLLCESLLTLAFYTRIALPKRYANNLGAVRRKHLRREEDWDNDHQRSEASGGGKLRYTNRRKTSKKSKSKSPTLLSDTSADAGGDEEYVVSTSVREMEQMQRSGLVIERFGDRLLIEDLESVSIETTRPYTLCSQRSKVCNESIVVGDRVQYYPFLEQENVGSGNNTTKPSRIQGVVLKPIPRRNLLQRPVGITSAGNIRTMKAMAANIDQLCIVVAGSPDVPLATIDRLIVTAHLYNMQCCIILNKVDEVQSTEKMRNQLKVYSDLGYPVVEVSVVSQHGIDTLVKRHLYDKSSIFVGQSGVGKSSLVNILIPQAKRKVGNLVRTSINIGSHTTSSARLMHLLEGQESRGSIIDSPGFREIGLWHLSKDAIGEGFVEIHRVAHECKYKNCRHCEDSPGCAIRAGVKKGEIDLRRLENYLKLM